MASLSNYSVAEIGARYVTMQKSGTITAGTDEGKIASVAGNLQVKVAANGEHIFGVISQVNGDDITVQDKGYVTVAYTGTAPTVGQFNNLLADGNGGVKVDNTTPGDPFFVVAVDTTAGTVTFDLG